MLLQLTVENYKSIHKPVTFSMISTNDFLHEDYLIHRKFFNLLPTTLIIGTNGAGKSNLFQAVLYLQMILKNEKDLVVYPHKMSQKDQPTSMDLQFIINDLRYSYGIDLLSNQVVYEYFNVYRGDEEIPIYTRENEVYHGIDLDEVKSYVGKEKIFLSILNQYASNAYVKEAYHYLTEQLVVLLSNEINDEKKAYQYFKQQLIQKTVNQLMNHINIGIKGYHLNEDQVIVEYENMDLELSEESTGTRRFFCMLVIITEALLNGKVLLVDELEKNLHITLVKHLIHLFNHRMSNLKQAQLIFSTHNTSLLDLNYFRKDQIWFMEKDLNSMTTLLYSLYNIIDVQNNENIERGYIIGKYGATFKFKQNGVNLYEE